MVIKLRNCKKKTKMVSIALCLCVASAVLMLNSCAGVGAKTPTALLPMNPSTLQAGLEVRYYNADDKNYQHISQMPSGDLEETWGKAGEPIKIIDHQFGKGPVFGSGLSTKVGVRMVGLIHFPHAGTYYLRTLSNDGVMVFIGDRIVLNDSWRHSDRFKISDPITVSAGGWYSLKIKYFQHKGAAVLKLYWQFPDSNTFEIIPAKAYAHPKKT
ncbi:MAG: PA14 domain-containing protein [Desulfobacula sp.]|nr:PA14 domain-containing protein [Desulfobacula sp.]